MITVRILLLVLLAMVLPLRSALALAVAVHCGQQDSPQTVRVLHVDERMAHHDGGGPSVHVHGGSHALHADVADSADASPDEPPTALGDCGMNAAWCSSAPVVTSAPGISLPAVDDVADFPFYLARVASFLADGPERPPRFV